MTCVYKPKYIPHYQAGIKTAASRGDGYSVAIDWNRAYPDSSSFVVAYNIYYSTVREDVFAEGPKFVSPSTTNTATTIVELTPGDAYYFAVRGTEYDPDWYDLTSLPLAPDLRLYPEGMLLVDIDKESTSIPVSDLSTFPSYGVVQIGSELIRYTNKDIPADSLTGLTRGFEFSEIRIHQTDGYDGYETHEDPLVRFWKGYEDPNTVVFQATPAFRYPNLPFTNADGYRSVAQDILTTDLSASDSSQADFQKYDYTGWHRTDPLALLRGDCVGSYYGGEQFCADGYLGVGRQLRGIPFEDVNHQRQEALLEMTGELCTLVKRVWKGIRCSCYIATAEHPDDRCPKCFGSGQVVGYEQFFNPRRSDGRILVRFEPSEDDLKMENAGLESSFAPSCWTLVYPAVKDRDFIIRYNEDGTPEFRYELISVTRNKLLEGFSGRQAFKAQRVRKTDPIYQVGVFHNSAEFPSTLTTSIGYMAGPNGILIPHTHTVVISETITSVAQINQLTSISNGHNHIVRNGVVIAGDLNHTHTLVL